MRTELTRLKITTTSKTFLLRACTAEACDRALTTSVFDSATRRLTSVDKSPDNWTLAAKSSLASAIIANSRACQLVGNGRISSVAVRQLDYAAMQAASRHMVMASRLNLR